MRVPPDEVIGWDGRSEGTVERDRDPCPVCPMSEALDPRIETVGSDLRVTRLIARDFRNHADLELTPTARFVALVGENGAGKTNLLEAISLFVPGRGLRRAEFATMARAAGPGGFAVSLTLDRDGAEHRLGTGLEPPGPAGRRGGQDGPPRCPGGLVAPLLG